MPLSMGLFSDRRKIGSGSVGHVYAGTYESHPVAIKKHKMDGSMMDQKALSEFEIEVLSPYYSLHLLFRCECQF
jgi:hypothetical protein